MTWSGEHRALVVEEFLKNGESFVAIQNSLGRHFWRSRHDFVPTRKANTPAGFQLLTNRIGCKEKTSWSKNQFERESNGARSNFSWGEF